MDAAHGLEEVSKMSVTHGSQRVAPARSRCPRTLKDKLTAEMTASLFLSGAGHLVKNVSGSSVGEAHLCPLD